MNASEKTLRPLRSQVASQSSNLGRFNNIQRQEARLARDLQNSTAAFTTLSQNVLQLSLRKTALEAAGAPVTVLDSGNAAFQIAPRASRNILAAIFMGALLACGAALLAESLDDRIRDDEEARRMLGTSVLGYFPKIHTKKNEKGEMVRPILNAPDADRGLLEGFRVLRSNVQFALIASTGQKLLVTSSMPSEGKSYVASNLAITMAMNGHSVIVVDCDLHRPRQHSIFGGKRFPGLTDALIGTTDLMDCMQEVGVDNLRIISAGVISPNPAELLNSSAMESIIERLGQEADMVIFDSPPLLATADSQVLASKLDGVIFVMQLGRVARSSSKRAFELLRQARARVIGVVFNQVEKKSSEASGPYFYSDYTEGEEPAEESDVPSKFPRLLVDNLLHKKSSRSKIRKPNGSNGSQGIKQNPKEIAAPANTKDDKTAV